MKNKPTKELRTLKRNVPMKKKEVTVSKRTKSTALFSTATVSCVRLFLNFPSFVATMME